MRGWTPTKEIENMADISTTTPESSLGWEDGADLAESLRDLYIVALFADEDGDGATACAAEAAVVAAKELLRSSLGYEAAVPLIRGARRAAAAFTRLATGGE
jgi:hypothetical protein